MLDGLQREVLQEDTVRYAVAKFKMELMERLESTRSHLTVLPEERERLKSEIGNLARAIAAERQSRALLSELKKRERCLEEISEELL